MGWGAHSCHTAAWRAKIFGINDLPPPPHWASEVCPPGRRAGRRVGMGTPGGGRREGGEDERGRTLTPHSQHLMGCSVDTRSLLIWSAFPCGFHPAWVTPPSVSASGRPSTLGGHPCPTQLPLCPRPLSVSASLHLSAPPPCLTPRLGPIPRALGPIRNQLGFPRETGWCQEPRGFPDLHPSWSVCFSKSHSQSMAPTCPQTGHSR